MTIQRVRRAIREVVPIMRVASAVCFVIAGLIAGPLHLFGTSLRLAERILLAVGWASYAAAIYVIARISEEA